MWAPAGNAQTLEAAPAPVSPSLPEISFGWSAAEGVHTYATGNTNNAGGVTAGLRGVF
jgi:hypothetical protein